MTCGWFFWSIDFKIESKAHMTVAWVVKTRKKYFFACSLASDLIYEMSP
jgi:hypothetical protein